MNAAPVTSAATSRLKFQHGSQAEHFRVFQGLPGKAGERVGRAAARAHDELEVGLKRPSGPHLILIDRSDKTFEAARGPDGRRQSLKVKIKRLGSRRDVSVGGGNTKFVLGPPIRKADEFEPGVCVIVDKVAVGRAVGSPREDADAAVVVPADAIYFCSTTE